MKLKDFVNVSQNKNTKQIVLSIKARELKKRGLTPEQFLKMTFIKLKKGGKK